MILVCGATGELGQRIVERLSERRVPFRVLVRPGRPAPAAPEIVEGDLRDPSSLVRAVTGATTVISTVTAIGRLLGGEKGTSLEAVDRDGHARLIDAAERAGVERFVFISAAGFRKQPAASTPFGAAKNATEDRLVASSLREVVVRPDMYQEDWLSPKTQFDWPNRKVIIFGKGETPARYVAVHDVAELVTQLTLESEPPRIVEVGGPDALSRKQAVDVFERALGEPISRRHVPRVVLRAASRALRPVRPVTASVMGMALHADLHAATWDDAPLRARGVAPRSVSEYAHHVTAA